MKRLLLLPLLCLMPAAQAMDYVKCEAIQKAMSRLSVQKNQLTDDNSFAEKIVADCRYLKPDRAAVLACQDAGLKQYLASPERESHNQKLKQINTRLDKVQADYEVEGCY